MITQVTLPGSASCATHNRSLPTKRHRAIPSTFTHSSFTQCRSTVSSSDFSSSDISDLAQESNASAEHSSDTLKNHHHGDISTSHQHSDNVAAAETSPSTNEQGNSIFADEKFNKQGRDQLRRLARTLSSILRQVDGDVLEQPVVLERIHALLLLQPLSVVETSSNGLSSQHSDHNQQQHNYQQQPSSSNETLEPAVKSSTSVVDIYAAELAAILGHTAHTQDSDSSTTETVAVDSGVVQLGGAEVDADWLNNEVVQTALFASILHEVYK